MAQLPWPQMNANERKYATRSSYNRSACLSVRIAACFPLLDLYFVIVVST
jgi:hypothetical protein